MLSRVLLGKSRFPWIPLLWADLSGQTHCYSLAGSWCWPTEPAALSFKPWRWPQAARPSGPVSQTSARARLFGGRRPGRHSPQRVAPSCLRLDFNQHCFQILVSCPTCMLEMLKQQWTLAFSFLSLLLTVFVFFNVSTGDVKLYPSSVILEDRDNMLKKHPVFWTTACYKEPLFPLSLES